MNVDRRRVLQVSALSLTGGVAFTSISPTPAMAAGLDSPGEVELTTDTQLDGLYVTEDDLDIELNWSGIETDEDVSVELYVSANSGEFGGAPVATGEIAVTEPSEGGSVGEDIAWADALWDTTFDERQAVNILSGDGSVSPGTVSSGPKTTTTLHFKLVFAHPSEVGDTVTTALDFTHINDGWSPEETSGWSTEPSGLGNLNDGDSSTGVESGEVYTHNQDTGYITVQFEEPQDVSEISYNVNTTSNPSGDSTGRLTLTVRNDGASEEIAYDSLYNLRTGGSPSLGGTDSIGLDKVTEVELAVNIDFSNDTWSYTGSIYLDFYDFDLIE